MVTAQPLATITCIFAAIQAVRASAVRGVAPEKLDLYQPNSQQQWTCFDGSKSIPFSAINDDYCDCPDGSDEPGTSACANSYFYCQNKEHLPAYIKSWSVNDGVCDDACCDGSDEYNSLVQCPNRCEEVALEYQKEQAERRKLTDEGYAAKRKLIQEAETIVQQWQEEKTKYEDAIVTKRGELERYQRELDALEKENTSKQKVQRPCKQNHAKQQVLETQVKQLRDEIDILLSILHDLKRDHNHNFHDMAVKAAIAGYDEFLQDYEQLREQIEQADDEHDNDEGEFDDDDNVFENEASTGKQESTTTTTTLTQKVLGKLDTILPSGWKDRLFSTEHGQNKNDGQNSSELDRVRQVRDDLDNELKDLESKAKSIEDKLNYDYGKDREWLKLQDSCVEKDDGEYIYSLCLLGGASQKSHKDGSNINLGQFEKYVGDADNHYSQQAYTHGLRCWNGPERSVRAIFECGGETEILDVMEPEKCEYHFHLRTPAVCPSPNSDEDVTQAKQARRIHEEL